MVALNQGQQEAADSIELWYNLGLEDKQIYTLAGYAGTGKTFLINYIINERLKLAPHDVAYIAPTGKAASVLIQRGATNACTLHKLIYNRVEKEYVNEINGKKVISKKIEFVKKPSIKKYKLIILDEVSMVDAKNMEDLISYGIPILCCR